MTAIDRETVSCMLKVGFFPGRKIRKYKGLKCVLLRCAGSTFDAQPLHQPM